MPTASIPAISSAAPPTFGSAKKPSLLWEWPFGGSTRQHSRLLKITSALRNSPAMRANGASGSATFMRFTSPVRIIVIGMSPPLAFLPIARGPEKLFNIGPAKPTAHATGNRSDRMPALMRFVAGVAAMLAVLQTQNAPATDYPARPVRIIVPFAAGGPGDLIARLIAQKLSEGLGKQFYVDNQGGAGGNIGMGMAARAPADGHTIMIASSTFMVNPSLYDKVPYDPVKDFDPVTIAATTPNVLVAHKSVPADSVRELVALIRAGKYTNYATPGAGTPSHLSGELFKLALKLDLTAVPFHGGGPMIQSVLGG